MITSPVNNTPRLYIGSDPDIRVLNCALLLSEPPAPGSPLSAPRKLTPLAVFLRRNKSPYTGDRAVAAAVKPASDLVTDVVKFFITNPPLQQYPITLIVEGQSIQHALQANRQAHRRIDPDDILHLGQVAGILMGAFGEMAGGIHLVTAMKWKGGVPKEIHHGRLYQKLGWDKPPETLTQYSGESINKGDWLDLNDSLGLAAYGAEEGL
jgi:hypothetical protein